MAIEPRALSPNQAAKRQQIVAAAQQVILREGPARCTTREVARESGLNQGLIYYYFESHEEIIDAAMEGFADELAAAIVKAEEPEEPKERFWALFENYLGLYERPGLAAAWFEYLMLSARAGRADKVAKVEDRVIELLTEVLEEAGAADAPVRARLVVSYIVGVLIRSFTNPHSIEELRPEIARLAP